MYDNEYILEMNKYTLETIDIYDYLLKVEREKNKRKNKENTEK